MEQHTTHLTCACGAFHLDLHAAPIITTECHCDSCKQAAGRLVGLPVAQPMQMHDGGTHYVLYRKDRVTFPAGTETLREFRLGADASTRRIVTACCNTPVFLEFKGGHWLSLYANLWDESRRPVAELRTMVPKGAAVPDDMPSGAWATAGFYGRLLVAWIAMGFKVPAIPVSGAVEV